MPDTPSTRLSFGLVVAALAVAAYILVINRDALWLLSIAFLLAITGIFGPMTSFWDRFGPDLAFPMFRKRDVGSVERYFQLWLTQFGREQALFATMANENNVVTQYADETGIVFDSIDDAVEQYNRFVLIGEPGMGKSTGIKNMMAQAIYNHRHSNGQTPLPLWINLGYSENPVDAAELIGYWWYDQYQLPGNPDVYIQRNSLVLYLDGLNEMPARSGSISERALSLRRFLQSHPDLPVVVTCRQREYEDNHDLNLKLPVLRSLPLTDRRVDRFIQRQLNDRQLFEVAQTDEVLQRLLCSPYTLRMLIDIYPSYQNKLPSTTDDLIGAFVKNRYDQYVQSNKLNTDSWEEIRDKLQLLAYRMVVRNLGTAVSGRWAQRQIGARVLNDAMNLGLLRGEAHMVRFYSHPVQGHFAAPLLRKAMREGDSGERIPPFSVDLISQIGDLGEAAAILVPELIDALNHSDSNVRHFAAFALGRIGAEAAPAVPYLTEALGDEMRGVSEFAAFALGRIGPAAAPAVPILSGALSDQNPEVRSVAALTLRQIGKESIAAVPELTTALQDPVEGVRRMSALALGHIGEPASGAVQLLADMLQKDTPANVAAAGRALGQIGVKSLPVLMTAIENPRSEVRAATVLALSQLDGDAAPALNELIAALEDQETEVRRLAVRALENIGTFDAQNALSQYYERQRMNVMP
jgi:HEAT repeat protein/energy-coupling factor transporter ATP-binding protein EcfA2